MDNNMNNITQKNEYTKKYRTLRIIGLIVLFTSLIVYITLLCLGLPHAEGDGSVNGAVEQGTSVFFGVLILSIYSFSYFIINLFPIIVGLICLIKDAKKSSTGTFILDLVLIVLPVITAALGFFLSLQIVYK